MNEQAFNRSRRNFLITSLTTGAGLTLALYLPGCGRKEEKAASGPGKTAGTIAEPARFEPNAFVRVLSNDQVIVVAKHLEMGQGTYTGLATLVAEELGARWNQIAVQAAPANAALYNNLFWGKAQGTGGSTAIANSFKQMREAGATARMMLVAAAAQAWKIPATEITVRDGQLRHEKSGKTARLGDFAEAASKQPIPEKVELKDPAEFQLIGKTMPRLDNPDKITGRAIYTQDLRLPGMLVAVVAHPPRFGATVKMFDATGALKVNGVVNVVQIPTGVAVLAEHTWAAIKGRNALKVDWDESKAFSKGSGEILANYKALAGKPGTVARKDGDAAAVLKKSKQIITSKTSYPYLAHAAMEPMNCVMQLTDAGCEIWNGAQTQTGDQAAVAEAFGITMEQVKIHTLYAGGSFGRRANPKSDYVLETASIIKATKTKVPIKLVWTREDDMRGGYYRPLYYHEIKASLGKDGLPMAWHHHIIGQSILAGTAFESMLVMDGVDATSVEGAKNMPYAIPHVTLHLTSPEQAVPVQWWRSVGSTHTAFAVETFIDQLARTAKQDPVAYRRKMLGDHPRHLAVLNLAAEKSGWGKPLGKTRARGVALHESFNTIVAQVAEVTLRPDRTFSVDRVVIAVDCGLAVNPDNVRAQMEGGMGFGLATALGSEITLTKGAVDQSNFHDYQVLRMHQMPAVEVHIVNSAEAPTGVGEPATPVIAPAVANALYALTGRPFDQLPLKLRA